MPVQPSQAKNGDYQKLPQVQASRLGCRQESSLQTRSRQECAGPTNGPLHSLYRFLDSPKNTDRIKIQSGGDFSAGRADKTQRAHENVVTAH